MGALILIMRPMGNRYRKVVTRRLRKRDGDLCCWCGKPMLFGMMKQHGDTASIEHIVPRRIGGTHHPTNLRLAHYRCNLRMDKLGKAEWLRAKIGYWRPRP